MAQDCVKPNNLQISSTLENIARHPNKPRPFDFYVIHDLLDWNTFDQLRDDVRSSIKLSPKNNDLYKFSQSKDLKSQTPAEKLTPLITSFCDLMLNEIRPRLEAESKLSLSDQVFDITVSRYDRGNYLLCHNDDMKDASIQQARALAFVYYLTKKHWNEADGGALLIYESDASGEPVKIVNQISPQPNTLVMFKTSSTSWHSVQEVFRDDDNRLSINGWFHLSQPSISAASQPVKSTELCPYELFRPIPLNTRMENFFNDCVNSLYLMEKTCYLVRRKFKRKSEINLPDFLVQERFKAISDALKQAARSDEKLTLVGPYNKRHYKRFKIDTLPRICKDLFDAFRSELFFMLLSRLTGLEIQPPHLTSEGQIESSDDDDDEEEEDDDDDGEKLSEDDADEENINEHEHTETTNEISESGQIEEEFPTEGNKGDGEKVTDEKERPVKRKHQSDPLARLEFRHLEPGAYTLIHDHGFELGELSALDVILHFNHDFAVKFEHGGYLSYIDVSEENDDPNNCELLTVEPKSNSLSLVYRSDPSTCRFMKYITKQHQSSFQDLYCVYYERPDDLPLGGKKLKIADTAESGTSD